MHLQVRKRCNTFSCDIGGSIPGSSTIDQYILKAQTVLQHIHELMHMACSAAGEKIQPGVPFLAYTGDILCHMAASIAQAVVGFWNTPLMNDGILMKNAQSENVMGYFRKLTLMQDLLFIKKLVA